MYPHLSYLMNRMLYIKVTWPLKQVVNDEGLITDIHRMPHRKLLCIIIWYTKKSIFHVPCTVREIYSSIKSANNYRVSFLDNALLYMCSYLNSFIFFFFRYCRNCWLLHVLDFALLKMFIFVLLYHIQQYTVF